MRKSSLAGMLADFHQRRAASGAITVIRLVDGRHPFQLRRQSAPLRPGTGYLGSRDGTLGLCCLQRSLHRRDVLGHCLIKQPALHRVHSLGFGRKLNPTQTCHLKLEFVDQRITFAQRALVRSDRRVTLGDAGTLLAHHLAQHVDVANRLK